MAGSHNNICRSSSGEYTMIPEYNKEIQRDIWNDIVDHSGSRINKVMDFWWMLHGNLERIKNNGKLNLISRQ